MPLRETPFGMTTNEPVTGGRGAAVQSSVCGDPPPRSHEPLSWGKVAPSARADRVPPVCPATMLDHAMAEKDLKAVVGTGKDIVQSTVHGPTTLIFRCPVSSAERQPPPPWS